MANESNKSKFLPAKRPPLKRTVQRIDHNGQEYLVNEIVDEMSKGHKMSQAIRHLYPQLPTASIPSLCTKVKKHPFFIAHKELSLKLMQDKGAELQQNMLDLALNSRSDMVKFQATKDSLDRVYGEANEIGGDKPTMVFNFSFGDQPAQPPRVVIDGEAS